MNGASLIGPGNPTIKSNIAFWVVQTWYTEITMIHIDQEKLYKSIAELQRLFLTGEEKQLVYDKFLSQLASFVQCEFVFLGHYKSTHSNQQNFEHWASTPNKGLPYAVKDYAVCNINLDQDKFAHYQYDPPVTLRLLKVDHPPIHNVMSIPLHYKNSPLGLIGIINKEDRYSEATVLELGSLFDALATIIFRFESDRPLHLNPVTAPVTNANQPPAQDLELEKKLEQELEQKLAQQTRTLSSVLNLGLVGIVTIDIEGKFVEVNEYFCSLVGFRKDQLINHSWVEITHPADREPDLLFFDRVNSSGSLHTTAEKRFIRFDKKAVSVIMTANRIRNEAGHTSHFAVIIQDTTNKNQELEKFKLVFEQSSDPHFICNTDQIIDCNQAAIDILGYKSKEDVLKIHPKNISPPTQEEESSLTTQPPMTYHGRLNGIHRFDWIYLNPKGKLISIEIMLNPVYMGNKPALLIVWHDITAIKETKELLSNAKKVATEAIKSKNRYLSSLSCQLRTHLNSIFCLNESLVSNVENQISEVDYLKLKTIQCSASQLINIVNDIDDETKTNNAEKEVFDIAGAVNEICAKFDPNKNPNQLQLTPYNSTENLNVYGKKDIIQQIIHNILNNTINESNPGIVVISLHKLNDKKIGQAVKVSISKADEANAPAIESEAVDLSLNYDPTLTNELVSTQGGRIDSNNNSNSSSIDLFFPIFFDNNQSSRPLN